MQGCHTPPPPPPHGIPPVKWVVVLFGLVAFSVGSCLASSPPPVWYGCCRLLLVMSSLHALSPPARGVVCSTEIWYIVTCSLPCSFLLANGAPVPALTRFSAPVKKHWLGSFSIVLPPSGLRGFVPGAGAARGGREGDTMGGGPWTRELLGVGLEDCSLGARIMLILQYWLRRCPSMHSSCNPNQKMMGRWEQLYWRCSDWQS